MAFEYIDDRMVQGTIVTSLRLELSRKKGLLLHEYAGNDKEAGYMKASLNLGSCISSIASLTNFRSTQGNGQKGLVVRYCMTHRAQLKVRACFVLDCPRIDGTSYNLNVRVNYICRLQEICWDALQSEMFIYLTEGSFDLLFDLHRLIQR